MIRTSKRAALGVRALLLPFVAALSLATGCLELDDRWVLNPDGSGKVTRRAVFAAMGMTPEAWIKKTIDDEKLKGIEAWTAVRATKRADGRIELVATGYFKDLSAVELPMGGLTPGWTRAKDGAGTLDVRAGQATTKRGPKLEPLHEPKAQDPEELAKFWELFRRSLEVIKGVKLSVGVRLPGELVASTNMRVREGELTQSLDCAKVLPALDRLLKDPTFLKRGAQGLDLSHPDLCKQLFGERAPVQAKVKGAHKPLFDYAAEVKAAKSAEPALRASLGLGSKPAPKAAPKAPNPSLVAVKRASLGALIYLRNKSGIETFDGNRIPDVYPQLRLRFVLELTQSVTAIKSARLIKATDAKGSDLLLPTDEAEPVEFGFKDEETKRMVDLGASLAHRPGFSGFSELSGDLQVVVSGGKKQVDLGLPNLTPGAKGKAFGAHVRRARKDRMAWYELSLTGLEASEVASAHLLSGGKRYEILYLQAGDETDDEGRPFVELHLAVDGKLPKTYSLILVVHEQRKTVTLPFRLTKLDALGRPAKTGK